MKKIFDNKYFVTILRIVLGSVFMYASLDKIAHPQAFADIVNNYRILPVQLVNPMAIFLPWLEFLTGLLLITGKWIKAALLIYSTFLVIFIIALTQALIRGLDISCGCFSVSPSSTPDIWLRIIEDIILLFFCISLYKNIPEESLENKNTLNLT